MAVTLKKVFPIIASKLIPNDIQIFTKRSIKSAPSDVQIISTERVKPSLSTGKHLRTYKLSWIDQMNTDVYIPLVFFYSTSCKNQDLKKKSDLLKQSLAKTLTHYYPFAGRLIDGFSVDCNDRGAAFIEANVGCDISKFLQPPDMELLQQLIPPSPQLSNLEISERELLAVQVNLFNSGEMAIGVCFSHGVADGSAIFNFMKVLQATRFGIVSALIWGACIAVARERKRAIDNKLHSHSMYYAMNLRNKINPPVFPRCMGNITRLVRAEWSLAEDDAIEVTSLVREVVKAKRMGREVMNNDEYFGFIKDMYEVGEDSRSFLLTSMVGLPCDEVDFGWGKPVWFSLGPILLPDLAILSSASDSEGIEALVVMFKEDMEKFEQETSIMAYASPNPSIFIMK
ncbi:acylsugar acyltransferase 3 [Citrus clementina]|uniref:acylsugar acyltransferase 3 n=1 Tax=Citrus clementina TaxID=85681 RepID=UPI000CED213D|nr:acylsugar acyltransferase 3 [Citrus x clementina]